MSYSQTKLDSNSYSSDEPSPEEAAYWAWKKSGAERDAIRLNRALLRLARTVVWDFFHRERPDLVTSIVSQAFLREKTFRGEAKFTSWFFSLAINFCRRECRTQRTRKECSLNSIQEPSVAPPSDENLLLAGILSTLSDREQTILREKLRGASNQEIAEQIGLTTEGARTAWKTLRRRLREQPELARLHASL